MWYMSDITGELQESVLDIIKAIIEELVHYHFFNWKWHKEK